LKSAGARRTPQVSPIHIRGVKHPVSKLLSDYFMVWLIQ